MLNRSLRSPFELLTLRLTKYFSALPLRSLTSLTVKKFAPIFTTAENHRPFASKVRLTGFRLCLLLLGGSYADTRASRY
jgi:hypothetical protein